MTMTPSNATNGQQPVIEPRAEATGIVQADDVDRDEAQRIERALVEAVAAATAKGRLHVERAHDEAQSRLRLTLKGALAAVLEILSPKSGNGQPLIGDGAHTSLTVAIHPVTTRKAIAINDHLLAATKNRPQEYGEVTIRTERDEAGAQLVVHVDGSLYSISYLLFLVHLHLTQSST